MTAAGLDSAAARLADVLRRHGRRIVFAESCTAGLVSAALARIPGISEFHCGSAVVYRNATKTAWLKVPQSDLDDPVIGPVSESIARGMALGALRATPEAHFAAAVTGHLGPDAPPGQDGLVFVAIAERTGDESGGGRIALLKRLHLVSAETDAVATRLERQQAAALQVLTLAADTIDRSGD